MFVHFLSCQVVSQKKNPCWKHPGVADLCLFFHTLVFTDEKNTSPILARLLLIAKKNDEKLI